MARQGKTILLTTHYMFEADQLCDQIAIINKGRLVVQATPSQIKQQFSRISVTELTVKETRRGLVEEIGAIAEVDQVYGSSIEGASERFTVQTKPGIDLQQRLAALVGLENIDRLIVREPTLEEAYLNILK